MTYLCPAGRGSRASRKKTKRPALQGAIQEWRGSGWARNCCPSIRSSGWRKNPPRPPNGINYL